MDVNDNFTQSVHQAQMDRIAQLEQGLRYEETRAAALLNRAVHAEADLQTITDEKWSAMDALAELAALKGQLRLCNIDQFNTEAELAALEYQLNLACVDIACLTNEPDPRAGSSDAVHEDLHCRWCIPREETP